MGRSGCFDQTREDCAFNHCLAKFRDANGNPSTIKRTTAIPFITTDPNPPPRNGLGESLGLLGGNLAVYVGAGTGGFVVLCIVIILVLCRSRNAEKHKRRVIEEDYRVVATTLTNVNDSDGTTYEELCIDNPHYNRHDVQLPYKKDRKRLPGVSNAVNYTFKRLVSDDSNSSSGNTSKTLNQASNKPLPPIPNSNSKTLPNYKQAAGAKLSQSIDEYTEIGGEVKRRSNIYNPLDSEKFGESRDSHGIYESLRASKMMDIQNNRPPIGLPDGEYFTLAKEDDNSTPKEPISPGEYMVLAKEEEKSSSENQRLLTSTEMSESSSENQRLLQSAEMAESKNEQSEMTPYAESSSRSVIEDEADSGICESGGPKNDYYILEKDSDKKDQSENSDYIEPVKGDRHSYMQVLPEHAKLCRKKELEN
ncbi:Hypothetical predicted protein [Mytilus galloprovincialis]|uniref:Uncharacterized protein n=1 Tax=Mytilus galloprovincialis TaxID=29158 RepID=A0A8B6DKT3_MYTGA|nr:Hypothetical predicted protein [Mytilus galloprovincialis]